ncbi:hypothetical protein, partial [Escherichia coli]|uniref:hypothetical protein n=1 Tax=Escherichia coli TaxID=562 RepID=UPI000A46A411
GDGYLLSAQASVQVTRRTLHLGCEFTRETVSRFMSIAVCLYGQAENAIQFCLSFLALLLGFAGTVANSRW